MTNNDYKYFKGRAVEEGKAARLATCVEARICHEKLADAYRHRCVDILGSQSILASPDVELIPALSVGKLPGHGVGWSMLDQACDYARSRGFKALHSIQQSDDRAAITLEEEMGFRAHPCPHDMSLTILSKDLRGK